MVALLFPLLFAATEPFRPDALRDVAWRPLGEPGPGGPIGVVAQSPHNPRLLIAGGRAGGLWHSEDRGTTWHPAQTRIALGVQALLFHPRDPLKVLAGTLGGPYLSTDGGSTWKARRRGLPQPDSTRFSAPIAVLAAVPGEENGVLAGFGTSGAHSLALNLGHLFRTDDWGETWRLVGYGFGSIRSIVFSVSGPNHAAMATGLGVFLSYNRGESWARSLSGFPPRGVWSVAAVPGSEPDFVASAEGGSLLRWQRRRGAWAPWITGLPHLSEAACLASTDRPDPVLLAGLSGPELGVWSRKPEEPAWAELTGLKQARLPYPNLSSLAGLSLEHSLCVWTTRNALLAATQKGTCWRPFATPVDAGWRGSGLSLLAAQRIAFSPFDPLSLLIVAREGTWLSLDGGQTFRSVRLGLPSWFMPDGAVFSRQKPEEIFLWSGTNRNDSRVFMSSNGGSSWRHLMRVPAPRLHDLLPPHDVMRAYVALAGDRVLRSTTQGRTWQHVLLLPESGSSGRLTLHPSEPRRMFLTWNGEEGGVWESRNGGRSWQRHFPLLAHARGHVGVTRHGKLVACAGTAVRQWNRTAWITLREGNAPARDLAVMGGDEIVAIFGERTNRPAADPGEVWCSLDHGRSWHTLADGLSGSPPYVIAASPRAPRVLVLGTAGGGFFRLHGPRGRLLRHTRRGTMIQTSQLLRGGIANRFVR